MTPVLRTKAIHGRPICPRQELMLKLINTKLLIAILAALCVIASAAIYQNHQTAKATAILEQQQRDAEQRKREDEAFRNKVEDNRKRHNSAAGNESKTWKT